eukprot:gb/GFBE01019801.1/.p1 GENE.gb/GFBE01019801.1/~~gb/GFBE01019801.1/.p1  ORF type:complete len:977 (+),score=204.70 gb/GFBE01019801.1/:1-2931(+)
MASNFWSYALLILLTPLAAVVQASETCNAKDGTCRQGSTAGQVRWWEDERDTRFRSDNILPVNTENFNSTVTALRNHSLLLVFFDPRSKSFLDLRSAIEETADALARHHRETGQPLGYLGAVDRTVHSYLMTQEAPQAEDGWQDVDKGAFKFGRPRFFPLIIMHYRNGTSQKEFRGVVKKDAIFDFLHREQVPPGASFDTAESLRGLFASTPGPFVVGCGLDRQPGANATEVEIAKNASNDFNESGRHFRGDMVFAKAPEELCSSVFGKPEVLAPRTLYIRKAATESSGPGDRIRANSFSHLEAVDGKDHLGSWLSMQRSTVLEEITPDNSWTYLDRLAPLVIFMVNAEDTANRQKGEELFASIEDNLEVKYYQLVWADCKEFGPQFEITHKCPCVLLADSSGPDIDTAHISMRELSSPDKLDKDSAPWNLEATPAKRLVHWLENRTSEVRQLIDDRMNESKADSAETATVNATNDNATNGNATDKTDSEEVDDTVADSTDVDFLDEMKPTAEEVNLPKDSRNITRKLVQELLGNLKERLQLAMVLRESFDAVYSQAFSFNFSVIDKIQKNKHMRLLVSSADEVGEILKDPKKRTELWRSIEERIRFEEEDIPRMTKDGASLEYQKTRGRFLSKLTKALDSLRNMYRKLFAELHERASNGTLGVPEPPVRDVERRDASELSVKEFLEKYARPGLPVIITGLNVTEEEPWTLDFFRERCNVSVWLVRRNPKATTWGKLERAGKLPLAEFIDTFKTNATRRKWYLHDWSLPRHCPPAFGPAPYQGFTVPKYFAGDYFQRAAFEGYQHSWPSLFIGSNETQSSMHIDSGNTNFILHLLSGEKEWRFYPRRHIINLYQSSQGAHFHFDVFKPDYDKYPLARYAEQWRGIQKTGDLMFIPAGNPHGVRNLADIHGVSMNYVDGSNIELSLLDNIWHLAAQKVELYTDGESIPHGLLSDQQPMRFGEWKGKDWRKVEYDIHF